MALSNIDELIAAGLGKIISGYWSV